MSIGPNQHGTWGRDGAKYGKLPDTTIFGVDQLDPIGPWRDVEATGFTEVEQHRPGSVQEGEDAQLTARGNQVEIRHAAAEQRVSLTEVVMDVKAGHHRRDPLPRLVQAQQLGHRVAQR